MGGRGGRGGRDTLGVPANGSVRSRGTWVMGRWRDKLHMEEESRFLLENTVRPEFYTEGGGSL